MRRRRDRVASSVKEAVAEIILKESSDPNLKEVTVTSCEISPDLRRALIYFTSLDEKKEGELLKSLQHAKGFIKMHLARKLRIKFLPDLEFAPDNSLKVQRRIEEIIRDE